jgi:hypothetical protein
MVSHILHYVVVGCYVGGVGTLIGCGGDVALHGLLDSLRWVGVVFVLIK